MIFKHYYSLLNTIDKLKKIKMAFYFMIYLFVFLVPTIEYENIKNIFLNIEERYGHDILLSGYFINVVLLLLASIFDAKSVITKVYPESCFFFYQKAGFTQLTYRLLQITRCIPILIFSIFYISILSCCILKNIVLTIIIIFSFSIVYCFSIFFNGKSLRLSTENNDKLISLLLKKGRILSNIAFLLSNNNIKVFDIILFLIAFFIQIMYKSIVATSIIFIWISAVKILFVNEVTRRNFGFLKLIKETYIHRVCLDSISFLIMQVIYMLTMFVVALLQGISLDYLSITFILMFLFFATNVFCLFLMMDFFLPNEINSAILFITMNAILIPGFSLLIMLIIVLSKRKYFKNQIFWEE